MTSTPVPENNPDQDIEIEMEDDYTLEELVAQITDENQHEYIDVGIAVGNERE